MKKKIQPKILPGFMELLPEDQILFNQMVDTIRNVYEKFGFLPLDTPVIEYSEILLAKAGGETEKQIYRFNKGSNDLSLRFDLTVPLARYVSEHYPNLLFPFKRYQIGKVYRGERPQKGRFREFYQCDIDVIGNEELAAIYDAEMPAIIYEIFTKLAFGPFVIRINNRKILNGFFASLMLSDKVSDILRVIDKIDKIGLENVKAELIKLDVYQEQINRIIEFITIKGNNHEIIKALKEIDCQNETYLEGIAELAQTISLIEQFGLDEGSYQIDLTIARGLDYYTGTVYETNLVNYPQLGSICSGGRYDNLTGYYTDQLMPGIGLSIGLTRLFFQLKEEKIISSQSKSLLDVLVVPLDDDNIAYTLKIAHLLRAFNLKVDVYYGSKGMKQKMKYANRLGVPFVIVIGSDEIASNTVTLKNMVSGEQQCISVDSLSAEMLKKTLLSD